MGIGIEKGSSNTQWLMPLIGGNDDGWKDNTWLVDHLRQLADKIENEKPKIFSIGIKTDSNYSRPILEIIVFEGK
ncbi:MAG: hypothetical protein ACUZ8I_10340 [Candidatus Scalindua sp.]